MFEIVTSNATEELLAALGRDLAASRRAAPAALSFLDEAVVLVPDRHVATYLKLGLARETGLCANVRFEYLKSFFADLIGRAAPRGAAPPRVADGDGLTGLVLRVLLDEARLAHAELGPAREYVHAGADEPGRDLRRYQLAVQLARLYEEYSYSRPELLAAWRRGRSGGRDPHGAERWQRRVWLEIFGQGGVLTGRDAPAGGWITLDELVAPGGRVRLDELPAPPRVWAFGFSYLARLVLDLLAALGRRAEVRLYALSACVEDEAAFATAAARLAAGPPDDPFGLAAAAPATLRWARPAREGLRLAAAAGARVTPRPRDPLAAAADAAPPPPTLLRTLQHELLTGNNEARLRLASGAPGPVPPALGGGDGSLRILRCPSVRREAEVVANEIWSLVERDPALRFHEIAVIVGGRDRAAYLTHLAAALRECHGIPHSLADLSLAGESRVVEAVDLLLGLPLAGTTRQEVLRVATHPAVLRARFPEASADDWARWCDRLGIVHGADHADHAATYIEPDVFNWDQGLRRLALGAFMAGARSGEARGVALGEEEYVVEETGAPASAAQLGLLVRSLMADAAGARAARLTLPAWADVLAALVHTYVGADGPQEEQDLVSCLKRLAGLAAIDLGDQAVSYRIAGELARAAVAGLGGARGHTFADGVVVATFRPMRAVPFKVVFVTGLGEGAFPAAEGRDALDLRGAERRAGDVSPRERDLAMFLETLLATRERLYLSYVARDQLTGEPLQPSAAVTELLHELRGRGLGEQEVAGLVVEHPLRRWDARYLEHEHEHEHELRNHLPEARREAAVAALARTVRAAAPGAALRDAAALRDRAPALFARLREPLGLLEPPAAAPRRRAGGPLRVTLGQLRRFLECPLQGWAAYCLGLEEGEADLLAAVDEPVALEFLDRLLLVRGAVVDALALGRDPAAHAAAEVRARERAGRAPVGLFGEVERAQQEVWVQGWARALGGDAGVPPPAEVVRFGAAPEHAPVQELQGPLVLAITAPGGGALAGPTRVELSGRTEPLTDGRATSLVLCARAAPPANPRDTARLWRDALRGFLDHVVLAAAGLTAGAPHRALLCLRGGATVPLDFAPLDAAAARAYLGGLVQSFLGEPHAYFMPCEAVFLHHLAGGARPLGECLAEVRTWDRHSSSYGPITRLDDVAAPADEAAHAIVARRFAPLLAGLAPPAEPPRGGRA